MELNFAEADDAAAGGRRFLRSELRVITVRRWRQIQMRAWRRNSNDATLA